MKDCQGVEITEGCLVAVAGQGKIYTGNVARIRDNRGTVHYQYVEEELRQGRGGTYYTREYLNSISHVYTVRKTADGKTARIDNYNRLIVLKEKPSA